MERLTGWDKNNAFFAKCFDEPCLGSGCRNDNCELNELVCTRLAEYEDLGVTPEQIREIDTLYTEKCREVAELKKKLNKQWIPVTERLPEAEKEVEVTVERHWSYLGEDKKIYLTCRAIYEDGTVWSEDSGYCWEDLSDCEYDEKRDDYRVPEGWFEAVSYTEQFEIIDDKVIAWRKRPEPYKPE